MIFKCLFKRPYPTSLLTPRLYDERSFYPSFLDDLAKCKLEVVIESPFITVSNVWGAFSLLLVLKIQRRLSGTSQVEVGVLSCEGKRVLAVWHRDLVDDRAVPNKSIRGIAVCYIRVIRLWWPATRVAFRIILVTIKPAQPHSRRAIIAVNPRDPQLHNNGVRIDRPG